MPRRAAKVDDNQADIVRAFRKMGATVQPLHGVGLGCPDLLVGYRGSNLLVEVKDGNKVPSAQRLTSWQEKWHFEWRGQACVVCSVDEAIDLLRNSPAEVPLVGSIM